MHAWWTEADTLRHVLAEWHRAVPNVQASQTQEGFVFAPDAPPATLLAFARQALPHARITAVPSVRAAAEALAHEVIHATDDDARWRLHIASCYGSGRAGENRCRLIDEGFVEIMRRRRRHRLRHRLPDGAPPVEDEAWIQFLLVAPDRAVVSVADPTTARAWRHSLVPFPAGRIPVASDKAAPCRAFAKLAEAEVRLGQSILPGQTVVDLGACPGSWTYWAVRRGARVVAVDRSPLRADLMAHERVHFTQGDAFKFEPVAPVDWLVCDVIAAPRRSVDLALRWAAQGWARRLVVTIKFKGDSEYPILDELKSALALRCEEFRLARLCANRNEACVMAVLPAEPGRNSP